MTNVNYGVSRKVGQFSDGLNHHRLEAGGLRTGLRPSKGDIALKRTVCTGPAFGGLKPVWNNQHRRSRFQRRLGAGVSRRRFP